MCAHSYTVALLFIKFCGSFTQRDTTERKWETKWGRKRMVRVYSVCSQLTLHECVAMCVRPLLQVVTSHFQYPLLFHSVQLYPIQLSLSLSYTHTHTKIDSVSIKKDDAIEDDDNSHLTFTNLLSREMGIEEGKRKGGKGMDR